MPSETEQHRFHVATALWASEHTAHNALEFKFLLSGTQELYCERADKFIAVMAIITESTASNELRPTLNTGEL
jgi:hypothetical protein